MVQARLVLFICIILLHKNEAKTFDEKVKYYKELISTNISLSQNYELPSDNRQYFGEEMDNEVIGYGEFDFIIIGAGATGAVLASRLSEVAKWKILLIEAGGEEDDFSKIPGYFYNLIFSRMNWGYYTTPQKTCCLGMIDKKCQFPRGKAMGGSTSINGIGYSRGNRHDYNYWEELGNYGWSFKHLLPYFIKSENSTINGDTEFRGKKGPLSVQYSQTSTEFIKKIFAANKELGNKYVDYNGRQQIGFSKLQSFIRKGKRWSTAQGYITPVKNERKNLIISSNSLATKILINNNCKKAYGVEFVKEGKKFRATALKEVLVSGGSINSPQLLMLSGIGPKKQLESLNITVIQDLPVGQHLQEHPLFLGLAFRTNYTMTDETFYKPIESYVKGRGPLTLAGNSAVLNFFDTNRTSTVPKFEQIFIVPNITGSVNANNYDNRMLAFESSIKNITDFRIQLILLHPKSLGSVTLKSKNPIDFPNINLNMFSDAEGEDIESMYQGIRQTLKIIGTKPFREIDTRLLPLPICEGFNTNSRHYWYCAIRHASGITFHAMGTNRMGISSKNSVVNDKLVVHGMKNLRVADASVFPSTVSGHIEAACVVVGEKLADLIKEYYKEN